MISSTQNATCSVEPGTTEDLGVILRILGYTRTSFAVKGGGHASNQGFSSTKGVQIAMYRFPEVTYDARTKTVTIGTGLIWDEVYAALEPYNVNVVGGRVTGVGVASFTLGGGYSWKTNQYGLTLLVDTVQAFELVLPNGTVTTVTATSNTDSFFGLKGGFNNFVEQGVVTTFVLKTVPQTQVWGGLITYTTSMLPPARFRTGQPGVSALIFYDAPTPLTKKTSPLARSYLLFSRPLPTKLLDYAVYLIPCLLRVTQWTHWNLSLTKLYALQYYGQSMAQKSAVLISYSVEPLLPSLFSHNTIPTAYPPIRSKGLLPLNLYFAWTDPLSDDAFQKAIGNSTVILKARAVANGQDIANAAVYGNYATIHTLVDDIYKGNLPRLRSIKAVYDPDNVMGLTGGYKF
ncbi:hypothetical protein PILCRDRAFT_7069 [Piloderma croceum F 1598]|uniref:FAD-binding PCMH-type domain-containing protein n=1 Tax=Piloderma croceum (strain F 1598) TaxID=765440 RepID=A0A0C3BBK5_PILCF|nr:hypothetical protein PILCRDRAFT_7069 [Piloderma croceum F 1598]